MLNDRIELLTAEAKFWQEGRIREAPGSTSLAARYFHAPFRHVGCCGCLLLISIARLGNPDYPLQELQLRHALINTRQTSLGKEGCRAQTFEQHCYPRYTAQCTVMLPPLRPALPRDGTGLRSDREACTYLCVCKSIFLSLKLPETFACGQRRPIS